MTTREYKIHLTRELKLTHAVAEHLKGISYAVENGMTLREALKYTKQLGTNGYAESQMVLWIALTDNLTGGPEEMHRFATMARLLDETATVTDAMKQIIYQACMDGIEMMAMKAGLSRDSLLYSDYQQ